jgi:hypothetical protein
MSFRKYYNLERYLFDEVGPKYRLRGHLDPVDLYFVFAWKSTRAKNTSKNRLVRKAGSFQRATTTISKALRTARTDEERLRILMNDWGFRLPTATAVLSVLYPETFTVYDVRVCSELGRFRQIASWRFSPKLWSQYRQFVSAVQAAVKSRMTLRDKDRYLWGRSVHAAAIAELRLTKPSTRRAKTHARER